MSAVAEVFRRFAGSYLEAHGAAMLPAHRRAIADTLACPVPPFIHGMS